MKIMKKIGVTLLLILIAMQFYRPQRNLSQGNHTADFLKETNPSPEVRMVLQNACYDCHSDNTRYPWYNTVAPISFLLSKHVDEGKDELNFSTWDTYSGKRKSHKLEEVVEVLENGEMPLKSYTWIHSEAQLTADQMNAVIEWAKRSRVLYQLNQQPQ
ncbi:heme-binding domain-containing protein [Maribacter sp. ANRC-HE7]|uniref:Heme-binding domain-containing protein n=1 Tax=Maribacter aquimaris TaxID=2737171 RepID=A0ABR7UVY4_9FLAO|nr:heme-binding domain-containing protein [Maribacter aquimaris]MBD0776610.1 heme-binding domain-containing protein [Maribacter aquimaris]